MATNVVANDGIALAARGDALVILWQERMSRARWKSVLREKTALAAQHPGGIVVLSIILPTSDPPDAALRGEMQDDFRALGPRLRKLVVVPVGSGLWQSVVRTIVRSVLLVTGQSKVQQVAATIADGFVHVGNVASPATPSRVELQQTVGELFRALGVSESSFD